MPFAKIFGWIFVSGAALLAFRFLLFYWGGGEVAITSTEIVDGKFTDAVTTRPSTWRDVAVVKLVLLVFLAFDALIACALLHVNIPPTVGRCAQSGFMLAIAAALLIGARTIVVRRESIRTWAHTPWPYELGEEMMA